MTTPPPPPPPPSFKHPDQTLSQPHLTILQRCWEHFEDVPINMHAIATEFSTACPPKTETCASLVSGEGLGIVLVVLLMHGFGGHYMARSIPVTQIGGPPPSTTNPPSKHWYVSHPAWETIGLQCTTDGNALCPHIGHKTRQATATAAATTSLEMSRPMPCQSLTIFAVSWMTTCDDHHWQTLYDCALADVLKQFKSTFGLLSTTEFKQFQLEMCGIPTIARMMQRVLITNGSEETRAHALAMLGDDGGTDDDSMLHAIVNKLQRGS